MILHDLDAIYCLVMTFFKSCPMSGMTTVDHVLTSGKHTMSFRIMTSCQKYTEGAGGHISARSVNPSHGMVYNL